MAYYLIDFENVKSRGMEGVELLADAGGRRTDAAELLCESA